MTFGAPQLQGLGDRRRGVGVAGLEPVLPFSSVFTGNDYRDTRALVGAGAPEEDVDRSGSTERIRARSAVNPVDPGAGIYPVVASACATLAAPLAARLGGTAGRLAIAGISSSLSRTGVAIVALAVAVSATVGVNVMVESFRGSVSEWLGNTLQSDIYVGVPGGSLDPQLLQELVGVPGVENFSTSRRTWLETEVGRVRLLALQMAPGSYVGTSFRDAEPAEVGPALDGGGGVLL